MSSCHCLCKAPAECWWARHCMQKSLPWHPLEHGTDGSPVWENRTLLKNAQRALAVHVIQGYRTVLCTAITLLASDYSWDLQTEMLTEVHHFQQIIRERDLELCLAEMKRLRATAQVVLIKCWQEDLKSAMAGWDSKEYDMEFTFKFVSLSQTSCNFVLFTEYVRLRLFKHNLHILEFASIVTAYNYIYMNKLIMKSVW